MSLEDHLRQLARTGALKHLLLVRTPQGYQASFGIEGNSFRVDVRDDPIDAVLVAIGAVGTLDMNKRDTARKLAEMME